MFANMITINVKPLSINEAYTGRRFKTERYRLFTRWLYNALPDFKIPKPPYVIQFEFGLSSSLSDGDNCIKCSQDVIASKYGFNDKHIKRWIVDVVNVPKGKEYLKFNIESLLK